MGKIVEQGGSETMNASYVYAPGGPPYPARPPRAVIARGVAVPDDDGRWTTLVEVNMGGFDYRLIRRGSRSLTRRERDVFDQVLRGSSNKVIAYDLGIAHATVRVLMSRIMRKVGVQTRTELVSMLRDVSNENSIFSCKQPAPAP